MIQWSALTRGIDPRQEASWQQAEIDRRIGKIVERHDDHERMEGT